MEIHRSSSFSPDTGYIDFASILESAIVTPNEWHIEETCL